jgi:uncharacterized membrane protein YfcA
MTPVMILIMGVKPIVAVGTDLAYGAITRIFGGALHLRQHTVHRRTAYWLAAGSLPSSILGVGLISHVKNADPALVNGFLLRAVAWALILVALVLLAKPLLVLAARRWGAAVATDWRGASLTAGDRHPWMLATVGGVVGFLVGLTSVGAGSLIIVSLVFLYPRWQSKELVGTDVFHAAILVSGASLAQLYAGNVNLSMMLALLLGSIPGVLLGSRMVIGIPDHALRLSLASVMLVTGAKLL